MGKGESGSHAKGGRRHEHLPAVSSGSPSSKEYTNAIAENRMGTEATVGPLLKTKQAAQYLAISERQLQYEVQRGNISFVRMGKSGIRFTANDLDEYVGRYRNAASWACHGGESWQV